MKRLILILVISLVPCLLNGEILTGGDIALIEDLLSSAGEDKSSLDFCKDWSGDTVLKTQNIIHLLNNPLEFAFLAGKLKNSIMNDDLHILADRLACHAWDIESINGNGLYQQYYNIYEEYFDNNVKDPADIFIYIEEVFSQSDRFRKKAFESLKQQEKELLYCLFLSLFADSEDLEGSADSDILELFKNMDIGDFEPVLEQIDYNELRKSFQVFIAGYDILMQGLDRFKFTNEKPLVKNTDYGLFTIGSINNDHHTHSCAFLIDPSGDDTHCYDMSTGFPRPFYLIIDLEGNDTWENNKTGKLACVTGGIGISADLDGNDYYLGGNMSFCSFLGLQYHRDEKGHDTYRTGKFSLGAGAFGISILESILGNDIYHGASMCQGFGFTRGAGLIIDRQGHDMYYSGGGQFHAPLRPQDFLTMSQGFGFGLRPRWGGGTGILMDIAGNDTYQGGVYSQGSAYWYALGMHMDLAGNDVLNAVQYAQGSGIHLAGGLLYNRHGDDRYFSRFGPGHGAGHDFAVGLFFEEGGNDFYSIDGGNGMGINNSVGIFIDKDGNDQYERNSKTNYGYANISRDCGSIGLFLDYKGDDIYPFHIKNNDSWANGNLGLGRDLSPDTQEAVTRPDTDDTLFDHAEIDGIDSVEELFSIASEWEVGENTLRVRYARKRLNSMPEESAEYIYKNRLKNPSGLEYRAIQSFLRDNREIFTNLLLEGMQSADSDIVKTCLGLLAEIEYPGLEEMIKPLLSLDDYRTAVISALGSIKTPQASGLLEGFINDPSEKIRVITARSLKNQDTDKSRTILLSMKDDPSFLIRSLVRDISDHTSE